MVSVGTTVTEAVRLFASLEPHEQERPRPLKASSWRDGNPTANEESSWAKGDGALTAPFFMT
jgi:hypothetical protein